MLAYKRKPNALYKAKYVFFKQTFANNKKEDPLQLIPFFKKKVSVSSIEICIETFLALVSFCLWVLDQ